MSRVQSTCKVQKDFFFKCVRGDNDVLFWKFLKIQYMTDAGLSLDYLTYSTISITIHRVYCVQFTLLDPRARFSFPCCQASSREQKVNQHGKQR